MGRWWFDFKTKSDEDMRGREGGKERERGRSVQDERGGENEW